MWGHIHGSKCITNATDVNTLLTIFLFVIHCPPMRQETLLGLTLAKRRGERGLREIATESGISAATLSRLERGYAPDFPTFMRAMTWLGVPRKQWSRYMEEEKSA